MLGAYATVRALERGHTGWLVLAGVFVGFGPGGGLGPSGGGSGAASQITSWVEQSFASTTVGGVTVYDLSSPNGAAQGSSSSASTQ